MVNKDLIIESAIQDLLREKECVIIPHFGALMMSYKSASIDAERQTIKPPGPDLAFNSGLSHNDGLLANRIADKQRLSFSKALDILNKKVSDWKALLAEGEYVELDGIGRFKKLNDGATQLIPKPAAELNLPGYGLSPVSLTPVKRSQASKRKWRKRQAREGSKRSLKRIKPSPVILTPLSILVTAILLAISLNVPIYKSGSGDQAGLNAVRTMSADNKIEGNSIQKSESSATKVESNKEVEPASAYHVIAGSFQYRHNAKDRLQELKKWGYAPEILTTTNGLHRISVRQYADSTRAAAMAKAFRETNEKPSAWLLKK